MVLRRTFIALFTAAAVFASSLSLATAAVSMAQPMACCKVVKHHCHQSHETMRCCAPSGSSHETPLPSSTTRIEPPAPLIHTTVGTATCLALPAVVLHSWARAPGSIRDVSPQLLFHVFRI